MQNVDCAVCRFRHSACGEERQTGALCAGAAGRPWQVLYRKTGRPASCPALLRGSHAFTYSEYDTASAEYAGGCGEPRSETNSCRQRLQADPQLSFNFGSCPTGTLYHRTSLVQVTQNSAQNIICSAILLVQHSTNKDFEL